MSKSGEGEGEGALYSLFKLSKAQLKWIKERYDLSQLVFVSWWNYIFRNIVF